MEILDLNKDGNVTTETSGKPEPPKNSERKAKEVNLFREVLSWVLTFSAAIAAALFIKCFIIITAFVPSGSMENTIMTNDNLVGFRLAYLFDEPKRGDIVIFYYPDDESQKFIKRVIGLPGDKVEIRDSKIYINGSEEPLNEPYLKEDWVIANGPYEYNVPEGCYFMMGDNRNDSKDSRYWIHTYVSSDKIIGKAELIYWPIKHWKLIKNDINY